MGNWVSLGSTFALPLGLYVLRNGFSYYRSLQLTYRQRKPEICPTPLAVSRVLNLLLVSASIALASTLPHFTPANIFAITSTRLQSSQALIFKRVSDLRPLTDLEIALKPLFNSTEARLIYLAYGPYSLLDCPFCELSDHASYLYYSMPTILAPHLLHLVVVGLATSSFIGGIEVGRWRMLACLASCALAAGDMWSHISYNSKENSKATKTADLDLFFWNMRLFRGLAISAMDALLGLFIWLGATKRFFLRPLGHAERVANVANLVEIANRALWGTGNVRNVVVRDKILRDRSTSYWESEKDVYEEKSVIDAVNNATSQVNDIRALEQLALKEASEICQG